MTTRLPDNLFLPAFSHGKLGFLFASIMAIMVYLATLAVGLQAALPTTGSLWQQGNGSRLTIEIPADKDAPPSADVIQKVKDAVQNHPGVLSVSLVDEQEVIRLLHPWITDENVIKSLPLPALIDVDTNSSFVESDLRDKLTSIGSALRLEGHAEWFEKVQRIIWALAITGWILLGMTIIALLASLFLVCKTAMAVEEETLALLHVMGAKDKNIALAFAKQIRRLSVPASLVGFLCAVATLIGIILLLHPLSLSWNTDFMAYAPFLGAIAAVPLFAVPGAEFATRLSVHAFLKRLV